MFAGLTMLMVVCCCEQVLQEFYNIFGPELKAVTSETKKIEEVLQRVDALVQPLKDVSHFSPFEKLKLCPSKELYVQKLCFQLIA